MLAELALAVRKRYLKGPPSRLTYISSSRFVKYVDLYAGQRVRQSKQSVEDYPEHHVIAEAISTKIMPVFSGDRLAATYAEMDTAINTAMNT